MTKEDKKIPLIEMFGPTIQGEGAVIGQQTYFLRFGGCDYRCIMCDSMHAVDPVKIKAHARWYTQEDLFEEYQAFRTDSGNTTPWVTYSGGNPCIHDLTALTTLLKNHNQQIAVETQGTMCPDWLEKCDIVTVSPKGPGMGEAFDSDIFGAFMNKLWQHPGLNVKVVVFGEQDIEFATDIVIRALNHIEPDHIYLSQGNPYPPGKNQPLELTDQLRRRYLETFELLQNNKILSRVKFLPQFHVWLWGNKQGV